MAKEKSFAAKVAKVLGSDDGTKCPQCGETLHPVHLVVSERSPKGNSWKYNERFIATCKCNTKEVYG
jgi:5-methylcytosine-specific restriction endonuclease McrA